MICLWMTWLWLRSVPGLIHLCDTTHDAYICICSCTSFCVSVSDGSAWNDILAPYITVSSKDTHRHTRSPNCSLDIILGSSLTRCHSHPFDIPHQGSDPNYIKLFPPLNCSCAHFLFPHEANSILAYVFLLSRCESTQWSAVDKASSVLLLR